MIAFQQQHESQPAVPVQDVPIAAMNFVANVDAIIFDLRENRGGIPRMIALISTYLLPGPTHLNDFWDRKTGATTQSWTLPFVPGKRMPDVPVFILTSSTTFSGAEEFCYNPKNLKRATLVGETTGGGAHPVRGERIDDRYTIGVPFARAINPITKTNWEGIGVEPDVRVPAAEALAVAQRLAAEKAGVQATRAAESGLLLAAVPAGRSLHRYPLGLHCRSHCRSMPADERRSDVRRIRIT